MADTVWTVQHDAEAGDPVKVAGQNADGTADLSRLLSIAGEDMKGGDEVFFGKDKITVYKQLDEDKRCTLFDGARKFCQRCSEFHTDADWTETCERYVGAAPIQKCKTCGGDHPADRIPGNCLPEPNWLESDLPVCRNFISDNLESVGGLNGIQCQASGLMFTSKSKLRREYKARGVVEIGNDAARHKPFVKPKPDRKQIKEALHKAMYAVNNEGATSSNFRARSKGPKGAFGAVAK